MDANVSLISQRDTRKDILLGVTRNRRILVE